MKLLKRILSLLLACLCVFSLFACGGDGDDPSKDDSGNSKPEKQYKEIKYWLNSSGYLLSDENGNFLGAEDAKYAYNWLKEHRNYKDCEQYLARFTVVTDTLSHITKTQTDAFGQTIEETYERYDYNSNGECFELSELFEMLARLNVKTTEHHINCEYDSNGVLKGATFLSNVAEENHRIVCKMQIEHDKNGNIVKTHFQTSDGNTWTNTYEYNAENQLLKANIIYGYEYNDITSGYVEQYQYDKQGKLIKKTCISEHYYSYNEEYTYDDNGFLIEALKHNGDEYGNIDSSESSKRTYTYDEKDRISTITENDGEYTLVYHYEDLYICNRG